MSRGREYRLRPLAQVDLESIWSYSFEHWSAEQADIYLSTIRFSLSELASGAKRGSAVPNKRLFFRLAVSSHAIFYQERPDHIDVVRILHQSMDPYRHLNAT